LDEVGGQGMSILEDLLTRIADDETPPEIGQRYIFTENDNPFNTNAEVIALDVKQGWVQYSFVSSLSFKWSLKVTAFNRMYKKITPN
jgi:hypothetical protein